jgi:hypothetical protein
MNIKSKVQDSSIEIDQTAYLKEYLKERKSMRGAITPSNKELFVKDTDELCSEPQEFRSRVMSLMYVAKRSRPDILKEVAFLSTKVSKPSMEDERKLSRLEGYLSTTIGDKLILRPKCLTLFASVDASYGVHSDCKGHSGIVLSLGRSGSIVMAKSVKQKLVARSSTESELVALDDSICYILWCRRMLCELGFKQKDATTIFQDNKSAILIAEKGTGHIGQTKHMQKRYFFVKEHIDGGAVMLEHLPTDQMISDMLTKPIVGRRFRELKMKLMGHVT